MTRMETSDAGMVGSGTVSCAQRGLQRERLWCACIQGGGSVCEVVGAVSVARHGVAGNHQVEAKDKALCRIFMLYPIARRPPCAAAAPIQHTRLQPHRSTEARLEHRPQRKARRTPTNQ